MGNHIKHISIGFGILLLLLFINAKLELVPFSPEDYLMFLIITFFYSQMPDVDQPLSKINRYFIFAAIIVIIFAFITENTWLGISVAVVVGVLEFIPHRTIVHSLIGAAIFTLPLFLWNVYYGIAALIAFLSHLLIDGEVSFWK